MDDKTTTLAEIKAVIFAFAEERDWGQFHDPKNLVMAIASELGELADHFRWVTNQDSRRVAQERESAAAIASELADIMMFAFEFATVGGIDVAAAIEAKLKVNSERYPVEKARGTARKYNQL